MSCSASEIAFKMRRYEAGLLLREARKILKGPNRHSLQGGKREEVSALVASN